MRSTYSLLVFIRFGFSFPLAGSELEVILPESTSSLLLSCCFCSSLLVSQPGIFMMFCVRFALGLGIQRLNITTCSFYRAAIISLIPFVKICNTPGAKSLSFEVDSVSFAPSFFSPRSLCALFDWRETISIALVFTTALVGSIRRVWKILSSLYSSLWCRSSSSHFLFFRLKNHVKRERKWLVNSI